MSSLPSDDPMDISSQEEDNLKSSKPSASNKQSTALIKPPKQLANIGNFNAPMDLGLAHYQTIPLDEMPVITSINNLVKDFPHMLTDPETKLPNCEDACNKFLTDSKTMGCEVELRTLNSDLSSSKLSLLQVQKNHLQASETCPWQLTAFLEKLSRVPVPQFYFNDQTSTNEELLHINQQSQTTLNQMLRTGVLQLPIAPVVLENELLHEAGEWRHHKNGQTYHFPPCSFGEDCLANKHLVGKIAGLNKPMILMQFMFLEEYWEFYQHQKSSFPPRPCVLCCRDSLGDFVTFLRANQMQGKQLMTQRAQFELKSDQVMQFYRNLQGQENGYDSHFMLPTKLGEPIIESILTLNTCMLKCVTLETGRRRIDQSALIWHPPKNPVPRVGESLRHF